MRIERHTEGNSNEAFAHINRRIHALTLSCEFKTVQVNEIEFSMLNRIQKQQQQQKSARFHQICVFIVTMFILRLSFCQFCTQKKTTVTNATMSWRKSFVEIFSFI